MKKLTMTLSALLLFAGTLFPQVTADLTIENQQAVGTDFFFDLYLTRTGTNNLYLGNADLVLTFNVGNFNSPAITNEGIEYCTFIPTISNPTNNLFTQDLYYTNTSVEIRNGNEILLNLNGPTPTTQTNFDTRVARIDNNPLTHRLGRIKVSGIINFTGFMNLQWKTTGTGVTTQVFTFGNISPWLSSQITINAINPGNTPLPVELTSFAASIKNNSVQLKWTTATEINNYGFEIEKTVHTSTPLSVTSWEKIGFIEGNGNSSAPKDYSFTDTKLFGGSKFQYRLKQVDNDGTFSYSDVVEVEVVPDQYALSQNYPNPFNPSTKIRYSIPSVTLSPDHNGKGSRVQLKVYDVLGNEVATLVNEEKPAGSYEVDFNASTSGGRLASGIYYYKLQAGSFTETKKMILLK